MNYFRWRRKIKTCAMTLLLSACVLWLLLLSEIIEFQRANYIPVKIQYSLSKIPENHAVLSIRIYSRGICADTAKYDFIVDKKGRWKVANVEDDSYFEQYGIYDEFFDERVLQDENIPWQDTKIAFNQKLLERAINMPDLEFRCQPVSADEMVTAYVWNSSYTANNMYYHGIPIKQDYTVLYLQKKFKQLEELGIKAIQENKLHHNMKEK